MQIKSINLQVDDEEYIKIPLKTLNNIIEEIVSDIEKQIKKYEYILALEKKQKFHSSITETYLIPYSDIRLTIYKSNLMNTSDIKIELPLYFYYKTGFDKILNKICVEDFDTNTTSIQDFLYLANMNYKCNELQTEKDIKRDMTIYIDDTRLKLSVTASYFYKITEIISNLEIKIW